MKEKEPTTKMDMREIYPRLLRYTFRYWKAFVLAILGMVLYAGVNTSMAYVLKPLLDGSLMERDPFLIKWMPLVLVLLFLCRGLANFLSGYGMAYVNTKVVQVVRSEIFAKYLLLPTAFFDKHSSGQITAKLIYHTGQITGSATSALTVTVKDGLTVVGLVGLMFWMNWSLAVIVFAVGPLIGLVIVLVSRRFRKYSKRLQNLAADLLEVSEEVLTGRRVVKIFGAEDHEINAFERVNQRTARMGMRMATTSAASTPIIQIIAATAVGTVVYFAVRDTGGGLMTPGEFAAFFGAMVGAMSPLKRLTGVIATVQRGMAAAGSIFEFLDEPQEDQGGTRALGRSQGEISFQQIRFGYGDTPVIRDISLHIPAGQTVAFVGRSGAGKSTLLSLLPRFYDPAAGRIEIDGHDIRSYPISALRAQISLVDQNVVLFNDSVARNIAYGAPEPVDRGAIEAAARKAYAWDFIESLPEGLDTEIGQNGIMLSGGQRQRIAIARALFKNAPILLLDEATSALDTESERAIQKGLENLMRDRTTLVIAHRLSTIQHADMIAVMHDGRVVEQGTHDELVAQGGHYRALRDLQFAEPADKADDNAEKGAGA